MHLSLLISDCPPLDLEAVGADRGGVLPSLPALSRVARFADLGGETGGWRSVAWRAVFGARSEPPEATVAAWTLGTPLVAGAWLAPAVRFVAAPDHLRLHTGGLLRLAEEETRAWTAAYRATFGDGLPRLHPLAGGFLLEGIEPSSGPPDPAASVGTRLDAAARSGSRELRRVAAELELWLHEHPLNLARLRRGQPAISALWLWGGGPPSDPRSLPPPVRRPAMFGDDAWLAGLAAACDASLRPVDVDAVLAVRDAPCLVQISANPVLGRDEAPLEHIDRRFVAPFAAAVDAGTLREFVVVLGSQRFEYRRAHRLRLWRRVRPWWETARR